MPHSIKSCFDWAVVIPRSPFLTFLWFAHVVGVEQYFLPLRHLKPYLSRCCGHIVILRYFSFFVSNIPKIWAITVSRIKMHHIMCSTRKSYLLVQVKVTILSSNLSQWLCKLSSNTLLRFFRNHQFVCIVPLKNCTNFRHNLHQLAPKIHSYKRTPFKFYLLEESKWSST